MDIDIIIRRAVLFTQLSALSAYVENDCDKHGKGGV